MEIIIRKMSEQSLQSVNQIGNAFTVDSQLVLTAVNGKISYRVVPVEPYEKQYPIETADYSKYPDDSNKTVFFAEVDGELAGQIRLIAWWNKYAYIDYVVVVPKFRGQGVGRALIQRAIDWAKAGKFPGLMVETQNNNVPACRLYESCGFTLGGFDQYLYKGMNPAPDEIALYWYLIF